MENVSAPETTPASMANLRESSSVGTGDCPKRNIPVITSPRVYVGNMDYRTEADALRAHMQASGGVVECQVLVQPQVRSKGCAIVEYENIEQAQHAIDHLHNTFLDGRQIFVREDRELKKAPGGGRGGQAGKPRESGGAEADGESKAPHVNAGKQVMVSNLPFNVRWQDLKDSFRECGPIVHANVHMGPDGRSRGQGTVLFSTKEAAQNAIAQSGLTMRGREVTVREFIFH